MVKLAIDEPYSRISADGYLLDCAAKLVGVLVDERSAGETCPFVPVAIAGGGAGDQTAESPAVKVPVGEVKTEAAPSRSMQSGTNGVPPSATFGCGRTASPGDSSPRIPGSAGGVKSASL